MGETQVPDRCWRFWKIDRELPMMRAGPITALLAVGAIMGLLALTFCSRAHADDVGSWFKGLKQPVTGGSCCDLADCAQVDSEWRGDAWWAHLRSGWTKVPDSRVLKHQTNIMEKAVICTSPQEWIYCFVEPPNFY